MLYGYLKWKYTLFRSRRTKTTKFRCHALSGFKAWQSTWFYIKNRLKLYQCKCKLNFTASYWEENHCLLTKKSRILELVGQFVSLLYCKTMLRNKDCRLCTKFSLSPFSPSHFSRTNYPSQNRRYKFFDGLFSAHHKNNF